MKAFILFLFLIGFATVSKADQLAYLSKSDAEKAAAYIRKQRKLFLFCGCCDGDVPLKIRPEKVEVRYTGYEEFYEVVVTYTPGRESTPSSVPVDLAYVWAKKKFKTFTVASALKLEHDPCKAFPKK